MALLSFKKANTSTASTTPQPKSPVREWLDAIIFAVVVATFVRWIFLEAYTIPTGSMENSLLVGDFLFVSKLHYGPRTPMTPLQLPLNHQTIWGTSVPSYIKAVQIPSFRLPGFSSIKNGDVVVFNYPAEPQHPADQRTNYIKRCVAIAGDTITIKEGQVYINGKAMENPPRMQERYYVMTNELISEKVFTKLEITDVSRMDIPGHDGYQVSTTAAGAEALSALPFVKSVTKELIPAGSKEVRSGLMEVPVMGADGRPVIEQGRYVTQARYITDTLHLFAKNAGPWNTDNFGPLWIPKKGSTIKLTKEMMARYDSTIIKYEHLDNVEVRDSTLYIDGKPVTEYTFTQNYYFMMGDNRKNSLDSRFWGFVPEDHIVGKAWLVWMSLDANAGFLDKVRWSRVMRFIN